MYTNLQNLQRPPPAKCVQVIRLVNLVTGGLIIAFGVVGIVFMALQKLLSLEFFLIFSPFFTIMFGVVLIAVQLKSTYFLQYLGFLRTLVGRGIFNIYISTQVYYYFGCTNGSTVLAWVSSMVLFILGLMYIGLNYSSASAYNNQLREQLE